MRGGNRSRRELVADETGGNLNIEQISGTAADGIEGEAEFFAAGMDDGVVIGLGEDFPKTIERAGSEGVDDAEARGGADLHEAELRAVGVLGNEFGIETDGGRLGQFVAQLRKLLGVSNVGIRHAVVRRRNERRRGWQAGRFIVSSERRGWWVEESDRGVFVQQEFYSISMSEIWLRTNRRVLLLGMILPFVLVAVGLIVVLGRIAGDAVWVHVVGWLLFGLGLLLWGVIWVQVRVPRLAYANGQVLVYLRASGPIGVPVELVECFFFGSGTGQVPGRDGNALPVRNLVMRIAEKASEYQQRDVKGAPGKVGRRVCDVLWRMVRTADTGSGATAECAVGGSAAAGPRTKIVEIYCG